MSSPSETDRLIVDRIRAGDADAWRDLIERYEGRLLAFVESRLRQRAAAEDVVQEALVGFLNSLPNYDGRRSLEGYLFSICAHKLTDHLRREGRRPALPFSVAFESASGMWQGPSAGRGASSIVRSGERRAIEEQALADAMAEQVERWKARGDWTKLKCIELLIARGWANKTVAEKLGITEQQVANFKSDFLIRTRKLIARQGLSAEDFPELHEGG